MSGHALRRIRWWKVAGAMAFLISGFLMGILLYWVGRAVFT